MMAQAQENNNSESAANIPLPVKLVWMSLLVAFGWHIRAQGIEAVAFDIDDIRHINIAKGESLAHVIRYSYYEMHPPFLYILLHFWLMISESQGFIRLMPLLMSIALIPLYYLIGKKINGDLCGLATATLITLSYGCVSQSCLIRHYGVLLLFISIHFYTYLRWRESHTYQLLLQLVFFGLLAVSTHFSAIFYIFCTAAFETFRLWRNGRDWNLLKQWALANLFVADVAIFIFHLWLPYLTLLYDSYLTNKEHFHAITHILILDGFLNLVRTTYYIYRPFPLLLGLILYSMICTRTRHPAIMPYLYLCASACFLSIVMYISGLYPRLGSRHDLWLLPFFIPASGLMTTYFIRRGLRCNRQAILVLFIIIFFSAVIDFTARYSDDLEYADWQFGPWQSLEKEFGTLGPHDLIITRMDLQMDMLVNMFPYISDDMFVNRKSIVLAPYKGTHVFVSYYYFIKRNANPEWLYAGLREAQEKHILDNVNRFVFLEEPLRVPTLKLLRCPYGSKQIHTFPPLPPGTPLEEGVYSPHGLSVTMISKRDFMDHIPVSEDETNACLPAKKTNTHNIL